MDKDSSFGIGLIMIYPNVFQISVILISKVVNKFGKPVLSSEPKFGTVATPVVAQFRFKAEISFTTVKKTKVVVILNKQTLQQSLEETQVCEYS